MRKGFLRLGPAQGFPSIAPETFRKKPSRTTPTVPSKSPSPPSKSPSRDLGFVSVPVYFGKSRSTLRRLSAGVTPGGGIFFWHFNMSIFALTTTDFRPGSRTEASCVGSCRLPSQDHPPKHRGLPFSNQVPPRSILMENLLPTLPSHHEVFSPHGKR